MIYHKKYDNYFEFATEKLHIICKNNISLVIGTNGIGKSYLLDTVEEELNNSIVSLGYDATEIFNEHFASYFERQAGDGYNQIMSICNKLASGKAYICLKNPENFLHIAVQDKILDVIHDLFDHTDVIVLIETHSPHILNGYFDDVSVFECLNEN